MKKNSFPKERIIYVKNIGRRYATYNIVHAAFSYCKEDDVQVLLDGDDEIIGKQILKDFNAIYQKDNQIWLAYSTYISNFYSYG